MFLNVDLIMFLNVDLNVHLKALNKPLKVASLNPLNKEVLETLSLIFLIIATTSIPILTTYCVPSVLAEISQEII